VKCYHWIRLAWQVNRRCWNCVIWGRLTVVIVIFVKSYQHGNCTKYFDAKRWILNAREIKLVGTENVPRQTFSLVLIRNYDGPAVMARSQRECMVLMSGREVMFVRHVSSSKPLHRFRWHFMFRCLKWNLNVNGFTPVVLIKCI
jgi:hypothetical protein